MGKKKIVLGIQNEKNRPNDYNYDLNYEQIKSLSIESEHKNVTED